MTRRPRDYDARDLDGAWLYHPPDEEPAALDQEAARRAMEAQPKWTPEEIDAGQPAEFRKKRAPEHDECSDDFPDVAEGSEN